LIWFLPDKSRAITSARKEVIAQALPSHPSASFRVGSWLSATCETLLSGKSDSPNFDLRIAATESGSLCVRMKS
jgi:hypothetical protein